MIDLFGNTTGAIFDYHKKYRYVLIRIWDNEKPKAAFIGLNPSTANEIDNDNTITKLRKVTAHNGFGGFYMLNLFAWVSRNPDDLKKVEDPLLNNDLYIDHYAGLADKIVFCWGNFKQAIGRDVIMKRKFPDAWCLDMNANKSPKHPLYCKDITELKPYIL